MNFNHPIVILRLLQPCGLSESETEAELASIESRGFHRPPEIQIPLKGLRLTEGTDGLLQCTITGNPKPKVPLI